MTAEYLRGVMGNASVSRSLRDYGFANGAPSPTEQFEKRVMHFNGRWRVGECLRYTQTVPNPDPDVIPSLVKFVEMQGLLGEPFAFTDEDFTHADDTVKIVGEGALAADWNADWHLWIYDSSGDTFTPGVYLVTSATDNSGDLDLVLDGSLDVALPSSDCTVSGYLLKTTYAEVYCAVPAPVEPTSRDQIAANNDTSIALSPWQDYGFWLPPATLVNGGSVKITLKGRLKMANLAGRPTAKDEDYPGCYSNLSNDAAHIYLTLDPFSSALVNNSHNHTEGAWIAQGATILGWTPENRFTEPTLVSGASTKLRFDYTSHGIADNEVICVVSSNPDDSAAVPGCFDEEPGLHFYVDRTTANAFFISTAGNDLLNSRQAFTTGDNALTVAFARQPHRGSHKCMTWKFEFTTADEIADYVECEIVIEGFGDGRTVGTESGTKWTATLRTFPAAEIVGVNASSGKNVALANDLSKEWSGSIVRTTPGNLMIPEYDGTTLDATGAPLRLAKLVYYTPGDTVTFADATADSSNDTLTHEYFTGLKPGSTITLSDAGATGASTGAYVAYGYGTTGRNELSISNDAGATKYNIPSAGVVDGTFIPKYACYYTSLWDYGGVYDIVYLDAALEAGTGDIVTGMTDWPIAPTFQGSDVTGYADSRRNSSGTRQATVTEVEVGGSAVGEVSHYDNILRIAYIRPFDPAVRIKNDDALSFKTYANERASNGTTWAFNSTAKQTATANALLVKYGPHGTRLSTRFAMSGPPTGDCLLDIRGGTVEINRMRSR